MVGFIRKHHLAFSFLLTAIFSIYATGCISIYKRSRGEMDSALKVVKDPIEFYVLDETFPETFGWRIYNATLTTSALHGQLVKLSAAEAMNINRRTSNRDAKNSLHHVVLYVKNDYAQTLFNLDKVQLSLDQVTRTEVYKLNVAASAATIPLVVVAGAATALGLILVIGSVTGSCPVIYAESPAGSLLEGEPFVGATHPQLERHDWLPLTHLEPDGAFYRLRMANEAPEIQHINLVELVSVDHPARVSIVIDKYGQRHTLTNPESPEMATNLSGQDVKPAIVAADNRINPGNQVNTNARAEDGLYLTFRRPAGATQAKLILRARNSVWLDYAHESLQRELGVYGPQVRQRFLEKDSAMLQQWALDQNIPLSVWIETAAGHWSRADFFQLAGVETWRNDVLALDLAQAPGNQVRIKLSSGFLFWEIDYVALDFSPDLPVEIREIPLATAVDKQGMDVKELLLVNDKQYYLQSAIGAEAILTFPATPVAPGMQRSLFLHAKGHYQILREPVAGRPSRRYLRQFTQRDAFPKYARGRYNILMSRDTIWAAMPNR